MALFIDKTLAYSLLMTAHGLQCVSFSFKALSIPMVCVIQMLCAFQQAP